MADPKLLTISEFRAAYPDAAEEIDPDALFAPVVVHEDAHTVEGDFSLDRTRTPGEAGTCVFLNGLEITGNLLNWTTGAGITLWVAGMTRARNIVAGGACICLEQARIDGVVYGHGEAGMLQVGDLDCDLRISEDHDMDLWPPARGVTIADDPDAGREVYVDDLRLPFDRKQEVTRTALNDWFSDPAGTELAEVDSTRQDALRASGRYAIHWAEVVRPPIEAGAPGADDTFARLAAHLRKAFASA